MPAAADRDGRGGAGRVAKAEQARSGGSGQHGRWVYWCTDTLYRDTAAARGFCINKKQAVKKKSLEKEIKMDKIAEEMEIDK